MKLPKETTAGEQQRHGRWYGDACGTAFALELVGERWALLIVRELMFGGRRFGELRAGLPEISAKVLTERLHGLEQAGIVRRRLGSTMSAQFYELTPWGYAAEPAIQALGRWAAASPDHDPTLPLSAASFAMSLRTMFDAAAAHGVDLRGSLMIGGDGFSVAVSGGHLTIARAPPDGADRNDADPDFSLSAPSAEPLAAAVYGKVPLTALADGGVRLVGDRAAAEAFVGLFALPVAPAGGARDRAASRA